MVLNDAPSRWSRTSSSAATRQRPAKRCRGSSSTSLAGDAPQAVPEGQRPAGAGPGDRQPGQPADGPGVVNRVWHAPLRRRDWSARPATSACAATRRRIPTARLPGRRVHRGRLVGQEAAPADHALERPTSRAATTAPDAPKVDPENRLLWRMNRAAARLRGAARLAAGRLRAARPDDRRAAGGRSPSRRSRTRRTVYGFIDRQNLPGVFRTFDFASPDATSPQRLATTVPQQALFLMNSPFVHRAGPARWPRRPDVAGARPIRRDGSGRLYRAALRPRGRRRTRSRWGCQFLAGRRPQRRPCGRIAQVLLRANEFDVRRSDSRFADCKRVCSRRLGTSLRQDARTDH